VVLTTGRDDRRRDWIDWRERRSEGLEGRRRRSEGLEGGRRDILAVFVVIKK